jgi:CubicO group peptidase (beta-lactamase class C family)
MEWWQPFYKHLHGSLEPNRRWRQLQRLLESMRPKQPGKKSVYSDIDLFLLGFLMEELKQKDLLTLWREVQDGLRLDRMHFHPFNRPVFDRRCYAPTEALHDEVLQGKVLQGEVRDENARALGGVAPHAGLFSGIDDVSRWALQLRKSFLGSERTYFGSPAVVRYFVSRRLPKSKGDWGLCFMKPSQGRASCGKYFSSKSFGHTGFTGTSLWMDPVQDLIVIILSNRVHPTRENRKFVAFRPVLHDWICELQ